MPTLEIRYLDDPSGVVVLMTDAERLRWTAQMEDLLKQSDKYRKVGLVEASADCAIQSDAVRDELMTDATLRDLSECQMAIIQYREPTIEDREAIRAAFSAGGPAGLMKAKNVAVERLAPTWAGADGEPQDLPLKFRPAIEDACYGSIDFNVSEDRRFFSIRRRPGFKG